MTLSTRQFLKDWHITALMPTAFILCLAQAIIISKAVSVTAHPVVLRSSIYFGPSKIGEWWELFVPPLVVLGFISFNFLITFLLYEKNRDLSRFLSWFSLFLSLLLGASTYIVTTSKLIS